MAHEVSRGRRRPAERDGAGANWLAVRRAQHSPQQAIQQAEPAGASPRCRMSRCPQPAAYRIASHDKAAALAPSAPPESSVATERAPSLDPEHPYTRQLWDRIHQLLKVNCGGGGWTESIEMEVKDGTIVFFEDTNDQPNPRLVGARVPKPPSSRSSRSE